MLLLILTLACLPTLTTTQQQTCEAGQEWQPLAAACQACGMGRFSTKGSNTGCQLCGELQYQSCEGQQDCKYCPGGTTDTEEKIECETAREINPEYFREVKLYNPKKQKNNTCRNGELCTGVCIEFDATRRGLNNSCPEYYILSWTEAEGRFPPETAVININPIVTSAVVSKNHSTPIQGTKQEDVDVSGNKVYYVGIPTKGCGMNGGTRLGKNSLVWKKTPTNSVDANEIHNYCIQEENTPSKQIIEKASFSVTLEAVVNNKRGTPFTFTPQWETSNGCTGEMYLNNTNRKLREWKCMSCPDGADCSGKDGDRSWSQVKAKFGYYRLDPYDAGVVGQPDWPDVFWLCAEPEACLGGVNREKEEEYALAVLGSDIPTILSISRVERCNDYNNFTYGYRQLCNCQNNRTDEDGYCLNGTGHRNGKTNRCLLCRACDWKYFPSGLRRCLPCPPWYFQFIGGIAACFFVVGTLFVFLKAALDSDSSPHAHLAQPLQKIVLNHLQLVSLASGFPLKWPKVVTSMFDIFENLANAAAFIFQPQCTRSQTEDAAAAGKSTFFFKQLWILLMPFLAIIASILFWTVWEARSFGLFIQEMKDKAAEKARVKPLTAAELFKMFHRFAVEDHKHQDEHKHKHRHRHHAHHDRLSHHGVHDMLFAICHDHRHNGMQLHLSSKKEFDKIFQHMNPATDDEKVEFAAVLRWYNENVKRLIEKKEEKHHHHSEEQEKVEYDLAIHIANEELEIHTTLTIPFDDKKSTCVVRIDDKSRTGKATLKGTHLSLPQGEIEKVLGEGMSKKQRRKSLADMKEKKQKELEEKKEIADTTLGNHEEIVKIDADLLCEFNSVVDGEGHSVMDIKIISHSEHHEILIAGHIYNTGDTRDLDSNTLVSVGETEVLFDVVRRGMYRNLHAPGHRGGKIGTSKNGDQNDTHNSTTTEKSEIEKKIQASMHAPTRVELEEFFQSAKKQRKNNKDTFPGLTAKEFEYILRKHPEIFGHLWPREQIEKCYENMESHVADAISGINIISKKDIERAKKDEEEKNKKIKEGSSNKTKDGKTKPTNPTNPTNPTKSTKSTKSTEPTEEDHFRAFEEFAFHYFMERRHHLRKLEYARERHEARRRTKTLDTRVLAADKAKRMGYIDKVIATLITLIYLLYPTLCRSAFALIACRQIGLIGKSYLTQDLQIECFAEEHMYWFIGLCIPALLILVIGLPGSAMFFLWRSRNSLHRRHIRFRFSILFIGYEDRTYFWEIVVAIRKLTVSAISVFLLQVDIPTQVLTAELVVVFLLVMHLHVRPYIPVTPKHNTLQHAETFALTTMFVTLVSGLLMFEDIGAGNQIVEYVFTFLVLAINISFLAAAFWWWLTLKLMDLENLLEHTSASQKLATKAAEFLRKIVPDWETEGQELEIEQEKQEAVEDLRHVNLDKLMRVQNLAHKWVVKFKQRQGQDVGFDDDVSSNTKIHPSKSLINVVDQAAEKAKDIEESSERAARKFMKQMEDRVAKAHDRLETRRRRRSSIANPNTKLFVVPEGVGLNDMGFKLKVSHNKVVVYSMEIDSPAYLVGVKNHCVLMRCNKEEINGNNLVAVLKNATRPLKLAFSARQHRPNSKLRNVAKAVSKLSTGSMI